LEKDQENDKALYRRGMSYLGQGKVKQAKADLTKAYEITGGKDQNVIKAL
jgi:Tfp pilus assembly protein PilF